MNKFAGWKAQYPCAYNEDDKLTVQEYPTVKDPVMFFTASNYDGEEDYQIALGVNSLELLHFQIGQFLNKTKEAK